MWKINEPEDNEEQAGAELCQAQVKLGLAKPAKALKSMLAYFLTRLANLVPTDLCWSTPYPALLALLCQAQLISSAFNLFIWAFLLWHGIVALCSYTCFEARLFEMDSYSIFHTSKNVGKQFHLKTKIWGPSIKIFVVWMWL